MSTFSAVFFAISMAIVIVYSISNCMKCWYQWKRNKWKRKWRRRKWRKVNEKGKISTYTQGTEKGILSMRPTRFLSGVVISKILIQRGKILIQSLWRNHMGKQLDSDSQIYESNNGLYFLPLFALFRYLFHNSSIPFAAFFSTFTRDSLPLFHLSVVVYCLSPPYSAICKVKLICTLHTLIHCSHPLASFFFHMICLIQRFAQFNTRMKRNQKSEVEKKNRRKGDKISDERRQKRARQKDETGNHKQSWAEEQ